MPISKTKQSSKKGFAQSTAPILVSACLIVKNEEQRLANCLASLKSFADEIIVVDTGSTDRTVAIAKKHRAKVFHVEWGDDFSQARNLAIAKAKGEWIFVIDADEILETSAVAMVRQAIASAQCIAVNLLRTEIAANQSPYSLVTRLFRNHPDIQFAGIYHESIDQAVTALQQREPQWQVLNIEVPVLRHYGYTDSEIARKHKYEFAKRLMQKHLQQFPEDAYMLNKLGALYIGEDAEDRVKGIELLQQGLTLTENDDSQNLTRYELYFHLGVAYGYAQDLNLAKIAYLQAIALPIPDIAKLGAYLNLGNLYQDKASPEAITYFEKVTQIAPNFAQGHFNYGIALKTAGRFTDAIAIYQKAIACDPNYAEAHQNLGVVLMKVGYFPEAIAVFNKAIQMHEQQQNYEAAAMLRTALQEF